MKRIKWMSASEARTCRREVVNTLLHSDNKPGLSAIKRAARNHERRLYGKELDVYRYFTAKKS